MRVRAVGSGHSFSDVAVTDAYLIDTSGLTGEIDLPDSWLKTEMIGWDGEPVARGALVALAAGTRVREAAEILDRKGLGLLAMGSFDGQTLAGALATSTHGSGIDRPPMCDMVLSMVIVATAGQAYRLEPTDGITDPERYPPDEPRLVQDDQVFSAALVNLGCMGVLHSLVIQGGAAHDLVEERRIVDHRALRDQLAPSQVSTFARSAQHLEIHFSPFSNGDRQGLILSRNPTHTPLRPPRPWRKAHPLSKVLARQTRFRSPAGIARGFQIAATVALWEQRLHGPYINRSHRVFPGGSAEMGGYGCEWSFPIESTLEALDRGFAVIEKCAADGEQVQTGPIGVRFVRRSRASLSPQYGRTSVALEFTCLYGTPGWNHETGERDDYILMHRLAQAFEDFPDARPHWGLSFSRREGTPTHPGWEEWAKVVRQFNPRGTFDNTFSERLGM